MNIVIESLFFAQVMGKKTFCLLMGMGRTKKSNFQEGLQVAAWRLFFISPEIIDRQGCHFSFSWQLFEKNPRHTKSHGRATGTRERLVLLGFGLFSWFFFRFFSISRIFATIKPQKNDLY
jgi:hypothetical protein